MAAKLASDSDDNELLASDRFFKKLSSRYALQTCGCPDGKVVDLWSTKDVKDDDRYDFDTAYRLGSIWCRTHGKDFCSELLKADK